MQQMDPSDDGARRLTEQLRQQLEGTEHPNPDETGGDSFLVDEATRNSGPSTGPGRKEAGLAPPSSARENKEPEEILAPPAGAGPSNEEPKEASSSPPEDSGAACRGVGDKNPSGGEESAPERPCSCAVSHGLSFVQ